MKKGQFWQYPNFELDGYIIRIPTSGEEILNEGRKLQHCVGGYADHAAQSHCHGPSPGSGEAVHSPGGAGSPWPRQR